MDDNELILVIDDCVYSGLQLSKVLNINYNGIINKIYIIIAFMSNKAKEIIEDSYNQI